MIGTRIVLFYPLVHHLEMFTVDGDVNFCPVFLLEILHSFSFMMPWVQKSYARSITLFIN